MTSRTSQPTGTPKRPKPDSRRRNSCDKSLMDTNLLPDDFKDFLKLLNANRVEYLLIGGYAVIFYGYPRTTGDMDIWIAQTPENAQRVTDVLRAFGFRHEDVSAQQFLEPNRVHRMGIPPFRIEILTHISGVTFAECWPHRQSVTIEDIPVTVINLEDLRANKKASGRFKDLNDLENLP